jgi:asparagine synthase (glutamine-hydrolysing)
MLRLPPQAIYRRIMGTFDAIDARALSGCLPAHGEFERAWSASRHLPLPQRAMLSDLLTYLPEAILVKVDRAAMATSLETRAPLLDHRVLEFALRLPFSLVRGKRLLKRVVYRHVPRAIMDRPKQGFGVPLGRWLRGDLRPLLCDTVTADRMRAVGIRDFTLVDRMLAQHMTGNRDHSGKLWALLMLGMWDNLRRSYAVPPPIHRSVELV